MGWIWPRQLESPTDRLSPMETIKGPHPSTLDEVKLLKECDVEFGRTTGPGGQNRNRRDTATTITHRPTGVVAAASERRTQAQNRSRAVFRLRMKMAAVIRTHTHHEHHKCSKLWNERRQGKMILVNPMHQDYPSLVAEALDDRSQTIRRRGCRRRPGREHVPAGQAGPQQQAMLRCGESWTRGPGPPASEVDLGFHRDAAEHLDARGDRPVVEVEGGVVERWHRFLIGRAQAHREEAGGDLLAVIGEVLSTHDRKLEWLDTFGSED